MNLPDTLNPEIESILGTVCFRAAPIARRLHQLKLYEVKEKAESEQAAFIHWALGLYALYGDKWREKGEKILQNKANPGDVTAASSPGRLRAEGD